MTKDNSISSQSPQIPSTSFQKKPGKRTLTFSISNNLNIFLIILLWKIFNIYIFQRNFSYYLKCVFVYNQFKMFLHKSYLISKPNSEDGYVFSKNGFKRKLHAPQKKSDLIPKNLTFTLHVSGTGVQGGYEKGIRCPQLVASLWL